MEICFVPDNDYGKFLQQAKLVQKHRGEIVDLQGRVLGQHDGIEFYTIGQRKGLGISSPKPLYVVELDAGAQPRHRGRRCRRWRATSSSSSAATGLPSTNRPPTFEATVKIRYNHPGAAATVTPAAGRRGAR